MERIGTAVEDWCELTEKAASAVSSRDWPTAVASYEALVEIRADRDLKYELARAYGEVGQVRKAIALLCDPSLAGLSETKRRLAGMHIRAKDYVAAKPLVDELAAEFPNHEKFRKWKPLIEERIAEADFSRRVEEGQTLIAADRFDEAEQVYLELVDKHPRASAAFQHLGRVYTLQRRWAEAISVLRAGLTVDPQSKRLRTALARALLKDGQPVEALAQLELANCDPTDVNALFLLQQCYAKLRDFVRVDEIGARLLAILPTDNPLCARVSILRQEARIECVLAKLDELAKAGDLDGEIQGLKAIVDEYPETAVAWLKLGTALAEAGENHEAIEALRTALRLRPDDAKVRERLTRAVMRALEDDDILLYVREAIATGKADLECHRWLAQYHSRRFEWPAALESAQNALALNPNHGSARLMVARSLMRLYRLAEALDELNILLSLGTHRIAALQLKGDILVRFSRLDDAITIYREALKKVPNHALMNQRLSYALLLKGDVAGFHRYHEKRREISTFVESNKEYDGLSWEGELSIEGKLLVWSEVGLGVGQNILHMTFINQLSSLGLDVVFEVEPRLVELCRRSFPNITVVPNDADLPEGISHHTPIGSLSRWFKPDLESFETLEPFLLPDMQAVVSHRARLQAAAGEKQLLVGISWTSNNPFVGDVKSVPLEQLLAAIDLPGVTLVNLQYGDHSQSIARAQENCGAQLLASGIDNSDDLDGLAAVVAAMDLVVCIGHTTAHMAGAVGTPNFVMLPAAPFAHWLAAGEQCVWYPATTLYRQAPVDADWSAVLRQVRQGVADFASNEGRDRWLASTLLGGPPATSTGKTMCDREVRDAVWSFFSQGAYRSALKLMDVLPTDAMSTDLEILRGDMLALIGHWKEARALYLSLRSDETSKRVDRKLRATDLAMYDLESALSVTRTAADEDPADRLIAASILTRLCRYDEALAELRALSVQAPQIEGLSTVQGTTLLAMGAVERAVTYLTDQVAMTQRPEDYALLGQGLARQGRREEALAACEKGIAIARSDPAANFWRTQQRVELGLAPVVALPPLLGDCPDVAPDDVVIFFAADSHFFWQHGLVLIGSAARQSPNAKCHVHVINPDNGIAPAIDVIRSILPELSLTFTYENVDFEGCSVDHMRTYYASVRFVRLAEVFARAPALYLCLDADGIVRGDVTAPSSFTSLGDVGMFIRYHDRPHMTILASAMMLRPTDAAARFMERVATLIRTTLEAREAVWFLDQIVLGHVMQELAGNDVDISMLERTYLDWFFNQDSLIWTGKGKRKSEDGMYAKEVAKYRYLQQDERIVALTAGHEQS